MAVQNFIDRYSSTLARGYTSGGGSISMASATGLPADGACNFFAVVKAEGANTEEVFLVTNKSGTTLTVTGAQANSSASNHGSGATILAGIQTSAVVLATGLVLLEEHTASNSTSLNFTNWQSSNFDTYVIEFVELVPVSNGVTMLVRVSTNGGSSYDSGSNYAYAGGRQSVAGSANNVGSNGTTSWDVGVGGTISSTASKGGLCATMKLYMLSAGTNHPHIHWQGGLDDGTTNVCVFFIACGEYLSATAVNAFQVLAASGNISSGVVRIYGVAL